MNAFKLEDKKPIACSEKEWVEQLRRVGDRKVGNDKVLHMTVSTVFVGSDAGYDLEKERAEKKRAQRVTRKISWDDNEFFLQPYLFETCVFGWPQRMLWKLSQRYQSWEDARQGHLEIVERLRSSVNKALIYGCVVFTALMVIGKFITLTM